MISIRIHPVQCSHLNGCFCCCCCCCYLCQSRSASNGLEHYYSAVLIWHAFKVAPKYFIVLRIQFENFTARKYMGKSVVSCLGMGEICMSACCMRMNVGNWVRCTSEVNKQNEHHEHFIHLYLYITCNNNICRIMHIA